MSILHILQCNSFVLSSSSAWQKIIYLWWTRELHVPVQDDYRHRDDARHQRTIYCFAYLTSYSVSHT